MPSNHPRLMLAAPASGSGKTTVVIGLLQALVARGHAVSAFKCGPDYIDPLFHRSAFGIKGCNLDLFFTPPDIVRGLFCREAEGTDVSVIEGVMGYYDGVGMTDEASSWQVAKDTDTPAVLIVNAKGSSLSLAAVIKGMVAFRDKSMLRGVILNDCPERLYTRLAPLIEKETGLRVFGHLPRLPEANFDSRHLGLVTPDQVAGLRMRLEAIAGELEKSVAIDELVTLAESAPDIDASLPAVTPFKTAEKPLIAVAGDAAFCFYYKENLDLLRAYGAELAYFSPLADKSLPKGTSALYLGGGYPEIYVKELSANISMRESIYSAVSSGLPTLAECGGFMYLQASLEAPDGNSYPMVNAIPGHCRNTGKLGRFGYITLTAQADTFIAPKKQTIKGHEFHYWDSDNNGSAFTSAKPSSDQTWNCFVAGKNYIAGFPHLYFWSNPEFAGNFVKSATRRQQ